MCRQQGSQTCSRLYNLRDEWKMPFTRRATPSQPSTCLFLPIDLPTIPRRSFHRCQGRSQENVDQRGRKGGASFPVRERDLRVSNSTLWCKDQCMALGQSIRSAPTPDSFTPLFQTRCVGYVDDFLFLCPKSTAHIQFTLAVIL